MIKEKQRITTFDRWWNSLKPEERDSLLADPHRAARAAWWAALGVGKLGEKVHYATSAWSVEDVLDVADARDKKITPAQALELLQDNYEDIGEAMWDAGRWFVQDLLAEKESENEANRQEI